MRWLSFETSNRFTFITSRRALVFVVLAAAAAMLAIASRHTVWPLVIVPVFLAFHYLWSCWAAGRQPADRPIGS